MLKRFTSRKFIATLITAIAGLITLIIGDNQVVNVIAGAAMVIIPVVVYCFMEGKIDAESVKTITKATKDAASALGANNDKIEVIEHIGEVVEVLTEEEK